MPKFLYQAKKGPSDIVEGIVDAESHDGAVNKLSKMGYFPISVKEEGLEPTKSERGLAFLQEKIKVADLSVFTRQLSELLASGMPLLQGLHVLNQQTEKPKLRGIIRDIIKSLQDGGTLSEGLMKHPKVFSSLFVNVTKAGEIGGKLEYALTRLADFLDKDEDMKSRVQQAMAYPVLMCTVGFLTVFLLMTIVIPRLVAMFEDIGQALPGPTLFLITVSDFMVKYWWLIIAAVVSIAFALKRRVKTEEGKLQIDKLKLKIPVYGMLIRKIEITRFSRTLATLLDGGIPILQALDAVISTVQNEVIKQELKKARQDVRDGASLGASLSAGGTAQMPPYVINMITIGEESGQLEKVLYRIAASYEAQTDKGIRLMMTLLEPLMILVMGLVVGFIVIAMLLPIFQFNLMVE